MTALVLSILVSTVQAQEASQAERIFAEGVEAFRMGDLPRAIDAFERSLAIEPTAPAAFNLASVLSEAGAVRRSLRLIEDLRGGVYGSLAGERLEALEQLEARVLARLVTVRVTVTGPSRAEIFVDDENVGETADGELVIRLEGGRHRIRASADGFRPATETLAAPSGESVDVELGLSRAAPAPSHTQEGPLDSSEDSEDEGGSLAWLWITGSVVLVAGATVAILLLVLPLDAQGRTDPVFGRTATLSF